VVLSLKIRQGIVLLATGAFFCVAIVAQLQGAAGLDVYIKAGAACLVLVAGGLILVRIVDEASAKSQAAMHLQVEEVRTSGTAGETAVKAQG
jgi:hypothetical protein